MPDINNLRRPQVAQASEQEPYDPREEGQHLRNPTLQTSMEPSSHLCENGGVVVDRQLCLMRGREDSPRIVSGSSIN
jgi:hypothetical protein